MAKRYKDTDINEIVDGTLTPSGEEKFREEEIQKQYSDYEIQNFSSNEITLYQERDGSCGEHYLVKDNEGVITIYKILEDGSLEEEEKTQITTEYLPETDKINMETGIKVNGKQDLNRLLEDFE